MGSAYEHCRFLVALPAFSVMFYYGIASWDLQHASNGTSKSFTEFWRIIPLSLLLTGISLQYAISFFEALLSPNVSFIRTLKKGTTVFSGCKQQEKLKPEKVKKPLKFVIMAALELTMAVYFLCFFCYFLYTRETWFVQFVMLHVAVSYLWVGLGILLDA